MLPSTLDFVPSTLDQNPNSSSTGLDYDGDHEWQLSANIWLYRILRSTVTALLPLQQEYHTLNVNRRGRGEECKYPYKTSLLTNTSMTRSHLFWGQLMCLLAKPE